VRTRRQADNFGDTIITFLLATALFAFPLQTVGVTLFGYPMTIPVVALGLLSLVLLFRPVRLKPNWKIAAALIIWAAGSTIATGNFLSLRSLAVFVILLLPTVIELPEAARGEAVKWFLRGGILNLALIAADAARTWMHLPQLDTIVPIIMPGSIEEMDFRYAGLARIRGLFLEPSYCAMYLAFLVIFLDVIPAGMLSPTKRKVLRLLFVGGLLLSRGMAGFVVIGAYAGFHLAMLLFKFSLRPRLTRRMLIAGAATPFLIASLWVWSDSLGSLESSMVVPERLEHAAVALFSPTSDNSSETERLGTIAISEAYVAHASVEQALAGEGFNSAEEWVSRTYAGVGGGWAEGLIANAFSTILLGSGLIGFVLYLLYIRTLTPWANAVKDRRFAFGCYFAAWILAHFATGMLIGYFLWGLLYAYLALIPAATSPQQPERGATP
jgi:hypothetical protein